MVDLNRVYCFDFEKTFPFSKEISVKQSVKGTLASMVIGRVGNFSAL